MNITARDRELRTFRRFADRGPLRIILDSIESRDPPNPDILCTLEGGDRIAFELVELIDEEFAKGINLMFRTNAILRELPGRLPQPLQEALHARTGRAFISFDISPTVPLRAREQAAVDALGWLVSREAPITAHNEVSGSLRERVTAVHVHPWSEPFHFDSGYGNSLSDPTLDRLRAKFTKHYDSDFPIELLMYTEIDLLLPEDVWRPTIVPYVEAELGRSPFRRVWLFKAGATTVDFIYPPLP